MAARDRQWNLTEDEWATVRASKELAGGRPLALIRYLQLYGFATKRNLRRQSQGDAVAWCPVGADGPDAWNAESVQPLAYEIAADCSRNLDAYSLRLPDVLVRFITHAPPILKE